jgi:dienelactone hydrolase
MGLLDELVRRPRVSPERRAFALPVTPGVVVFHARMGLAEEALEVARPLADLGFAVCAADLGGTRTYGNRASVRKVGPAVEALVDRGVDRSCVFGLAHSMGATVACNWLRDNPGGLRGLALVAPLLDLEHFKAENAGGYGRADVERAHRTDARVRAHNPVGFARSLGSVPMKAWYSPGDPVIDADTVVRFAREHGNCPLRELPAVDHGTALYSADNGEIAAFFRGLL